MKSAAKIIVSVFAVLAFTLTLGEEWIELETMFPDGVSSGLFPDVG